MEQAKLKEIKEYIALEYDGEDEEVFSKMKMYFGGLCTIEELYNYLENKHLLYPYEECSPTPKDVNITEEELKDCIRNKVLNLSKDENKETS